MANVVQNIEENLDQYDNFIAVYIALIATIEGLQDYTNSVLNDVRCNIYKKLANLPNCQINCSKKERNRNNWCETCKNWKRELELYVRVRSTYRIDWGKINSIDWFYSNEEVSKCFIKISGHVGHTISGFGVLKDIVDIDTTKLKAVAHLRNKYFGHNYSAKIISWEKQECIDKLIDILNFPSVGYYTSAKLQIRFLTQLRESNTALDSILSHPTLQIPVTEAKRLESGLQVTDSTRKQLHQRLHRFTKHSECEDDNVKVASKLSITFFLILLLIIVFGIYFIGNNSDKKSEEECLSLEHDGRDIIWKLVFAHVKAIYRESTIQRSWIANSIETLLRSSDIGVLITAESGYGKSTIVSNIICGRYNKPWSNLYKPLISYHICRTGHNLYNDPSTFIINLAGMIIKHVPSIGNLIYYDDTAMEFFESETLCRDDPFTCIESLILNPLIESSYNETLMIVIDAIDECTLETKRQNFFLKILMRYIRSFPTYIKFFVTSRYLESVQNKLSFLKHMHMPTTDEYNRGDIHQYVIDNSDMSEQEVVKFIDGTNGNFLFAKEYLLHCTKQLSCLSKYVPESIIDLYEHTLDRAFEENHDGFIKMLPVFEVISASYKPLNQDELIEIINLNSSAEEYWILDKVGNELRHFIRKSEMEISIIHKSFADFLTNKSREYTKSKPVDLVELAYHVSSSKNKYLEETLLQNKHNLKRLVLLSDEGWLHKAARDVNSYETIKLINGLIDKKESNRLNARNMTAPFISALHGNDESLKAFLEMGFNISQKIEINLNSFYSFNSKPLINACKYYFFCGYSLLHIASQNGHTDVVKLIIQKKRSLMYQINDTNLKPIHLAAENGHYDVFKFLYEQDKKHADFLSLHHAAEKGNEKVVHLLLNRGVRDTCLQCNGSLYWISPDANRIQSNKDVYSNSLSILMKDFKNETFVNNFAKTNLHNEISKAHWNADMKFVDDVMSKNDLFHLLQFFDDWYLLTCETALHAAIRNGHLKIIKQLMTKSNNCLDCVDFSGKTPLMSAITHGDPYIFMYLYNFDKSMKRRCTSKIQFLTNDIIKISDDDMFILKQSQCPPETAFSHLLAAYGTKEMLDLVLNNTSINWTQRESYNATPLHYAFCHNNKYFIDISFKNADINETLDFRSSNGSTPFHSAASCESLALDYSFETYSQRIHDVKDFSGRSILHYAVRGHKPSQNHESWYLLNLYDLVKKMNHNISHMDNNGHNIMHHACASGTYYVIDHSKRFLSRNIMLQMILQKDTNGLTPIETAFNAMSKRQVMEPIIVPSNCSLREMFTYKCGLNYSYLLSPHELCILSISQFLNENDKIDKIDTWKLVQLSANKSRLFPILMMKEYASNQFKNILMSSSNIEMLIHSYQGPFLEEFALTPSNALKCNSSDHSPLHTILMNERNRYWYHSTPEFFDLFLKRYSSHFLDSCFDKDGLNIFHRAAVGGHLNALKYLLSKGLNVNKLTNRNKTALEILINTSPYLMNGITPYYYDESLLFYIVRYQTAINYKDHLKPKLQVQFDDSATLLLNFTDSSKLGLCLNKQEDLSVIHISSAKGFVKFIKQAEYMYGDKVINCRNKDDLTPLYFAIVMNQTHISNWLIRKGIQIAQPSVAAYEHSLYNFVNNFRLFDWTCQMTYPDHYSVYAYHKMIECIKAILLHDKFIVVDSKNAQYRALKLNLLRGVLGVWLSVINKTYFSKNNFNLTKVFQLCEGICNLHRTDVLDNIEEVPETMEYLYSHLIEKKNKRLKQQCDRCLQQLSRGTILTNILTRNGKIVRNWFTRLFRDYAVYGFSVKKYLLYTLLKDSNFKYEIQTINSINDMFFTTYKNSFSYMRALAMKNEFHHKWISSITSDRFNGSGYFSFETVDTQQAIDFRIKGNVHREMQRLGIIR
ncbi:unnamed protein product [Mytilus coruscus]|uniref:Nephrocystin 3-like N-terminal domain-containing protein n=1 Tax=Mytilus coruscus TaxID=42192 RepID=A0A6J8CCA2_MYTCO|nr:unnamed protein product [Mytilus coruscus]